MRIEDAEIILDNGSFASIRAPAFRDFIAAQPPVQTLKGRSNWNQYTEYMLSNGRKR